MKYRIGSSLEFTLGQLQCKVEKTKLQVNKIIECQMILFGTSNEDVSGANAFTCLCSSPGPWTVKFKFDTKNVPFNQCRWAGHRTFCLQ